MSTDTVSAQQEQKEPIEQAVEAAQEANNVDQEVQDNHVQEEVAEEQKEQNVPLHAHLKERKRRQDAEEKVRYYEQKEVQKQQQSQSQESEEDRYMPVTKEELSKREVQLLRAIDEKRWIKDNPEKAQAVNERLTEFLKQKPNLVSAIESSSNRYEEAWELMDKLSPRSLASTKPPVLAQKQAPGSPSSVPKAAGMNQAIDLMNMTDDEFRAYRNSKRTRR